MAKQNKKPPYLKDNVKLGIMIENSDYEGNKTKDSVNWKDLSGAKRDVADMGARIKADGYQVEVIENHPDILKAIEDVLKKFAVNSVTHVQVLYAGRSINIKYVYLRSSIFQAMVNIRQRVGSGLTCLKRARERELLLLKRSLEMSSSQ